MMQTNILERLVSLLHTLHQQPTRLRLLDLMQHQSCRVQSRLKHEFHKKQHCLHLLTTPLRPMLHSMSSTCVVASLLGNFHAIAHLSHRELQTTWNVWNITKHSCAAVNWVPPVGINEAAPKPLGWPLMTTRCRQNNCWKIVAAAALAAAAMLYCTT